MSRITFVKVCWEKCDRSQMTHSNCNKYHPAHGASGTCYMEVQKLNYFCSKMMLQNFSCHHYGVRSHKTELGTARDLVYNVYWFCEHRTKFIHYFPRGHNLILQPQLQAVSDLYVNKEFVYSLPSRLERLFPDEHPNAKQRRASMRNLHMHIVRLF